MRLLRQALCAQGRRGRALIRVALGLLLALSATATFAAGDETKYGILRNYSGLPLVFPLQIKSDPGRDLLIALRAPDTWELAYKARVEGGSIFRVLVPVGTYLLEITPEAGADTPPPTPYVYPVPLTFQIEGLSRKVGQIVDLRGNRLMAPQTIGFCQSLRYGPYDLDTLRDYWRLPYDDPDRPRRPPSRDLSERHCD